MRFLITLLTLAGGAYGLFWLAESHPELKEKAEELISYGSFHTLEIRYTANQIMDSHRKELLKDSRYKYLEPSLKFYPYLLLEVKYALKENKTQEGMMLWDLTDGEMVIDTKNWEMTHGFSDCIHASAQNHEFKVLNVLAKEGGSTTRDFLLKTLHIDGKTLDAWIESCRRKKLIIQTGTRYRLHLQNPKLQTEPITHIHEPLVTKSFKQATRMPHNFSLRQIEKISSSAFGNEFVIRKTLDVYLPVHSIVVQNPDGSIHTTLWNALNGKKIH
jgi:hypothetical protein